MTEIMGYDLFGNKVYKSKLLRERFIEPPFSILNSDTGRWKKRKNMWKDLGIKSEIGREEELLGKRATLQKYKRSKSPVYLETDTSVFDPVLCEIMYRWFCVEGGTILDPFAGGSVRGIVANYLGYDYYGIELREEQVKSNYEQGNEIIPNKCPMWTIGDSEKVLSDFVSNNEKFDMIFTCPPYFDLEVYSDLPGELSNMSDETFDIKYGKIIKKACERLKNNRFAIFVVGNVRDKKTGFYRDLVTMTKKHLLNAGLGFYNDMILGEARGTACLRAKQFQVSRKVVKVHQQVLIFLKGDHKKIKEEFGILNEIF